MAIYLFAVAIAIMGAVFKLPKVKGYFGEKRVQRILNRLNPNEYRVLNDILILKDDGGTSQIDHVIVSVYGIFVIETKNYSGWIFGDEKGRNWTRQAYKRKDQFLNPIIQNKRHIKSLKGLLTNYPNIPFISIVVFSSNATFKKLQVTTDVVYMHRLGATIIKKYSQKMISNQDVNSIYKLISSSNIGGKENRKKHVKNIKSKSQTVSQKGKK